MAKFQHIALDECESTQTILRNLAVKFEDPHEILVSTIKQSGGFGRRGTEWKKIKNSLAMSIFFPFYFHPTLASLKLGVDVQKFLLFKYGITTQLKWPNDVYYQKKKIGGIICQLIPFKGVNWIIAGIGINIGSPDVEEIEILNSFSATHLNNAQLTNDQIHKFCFELGEKILSAKCSPDLILKEWEEKCLHMNQKVEIFENDTLLHRGIFIGIGPQGQAMLKKEDSVQEVWSGTLRPVNN